MIIIRDTRTKAGRKGTRQEYPPFLNQETVALHSHDLSRMKLGNEGPDWGLPDSQYVYPSWDLPQSSEGLP